MAVLTTLLCAQTHPTHKAASSGRAGGWNLVSIEVKGSQRYTPEEIIGESGLQVGQTVTEEDFKKATERLGATGAFNNVSYGFNYSFACAKLQLEVSDGDQFVSAQFDNFVWFSDQELMDKLRERVPLFKGQLPVSGELADEVSDALQALLIEHKVQGKADYMHEGPVNGPIEALLFTVSAHNIQVKSVEFTGAGAGELPQLQEEAKRLVGSDYSHTTVRNEERLGFRPIYLKRGYLKVGFAEGAVKIAQDGEQETTVDVSVAVTPGIQYKLADMQWSGNTVFPADRLQPMIHLKNGEPADAVQLDQDLGAIARLYGTKGYMAPKFTPTPEMDDSAATVKYGIAVEEGDVFKMGELEVRGLDEKSKSRMVFDWKLAEGQVYDSSYIERFLNDSKNDLPPGVKWLIRPHEALNSDKTVDVTLTYETK